MDKESALKLSRDYLVKLKNNKIEFSEAWLFGSFARGSNHENSDIDIAIVLSKNDKSFDTEVKLMTLRTGEETLIEPHAFNKDEFELSIPIVHQIINNGLKLSF
jgi:predicted nucleotidyltransferase